MRDLLRTLLRTIPATVFYLAAFVWMLSAQACLAQYRFTQWTADTGLPHSSVRGIVQTPDGYLWVATLNGLARFDGVRFKVYDKSTTPEISSSRFITMVPGVGGDLWMLSEDYNLVLMHRGLFITLDGRHGVKPHEVNAITYDSGKVWVLSEHKVLLWDESKQRFERANFSTDDLQFDALRWRGTGFWAQRGQQLICFNRGHLTTFVMPKGVNSSEIRGVVMDANNDGWIGTKGGRIGRLADRTGPLTHELASFALHGLSGEDWKVDVTPDRFERWLHLPIGGTDHPMNLNVINSDNEDNLWVGTETQGLYRIQRQQIEVLSEEQGLASNNTNPVFRSKSGEIWAGSWPGGLSEIRDGKVVHTFTTAQGIPGSISSLFEDKDGILWIGTHSGVRTLTRLHNGHFTRWTEKEGLPNNNIRTIFEDSSGSIWVGTYDGGIGWLRDGKWISFNKRRGLFDNGAFQILEDNKKRFWISSNRGIYRVDQEQLTAVADGREAMVSSVSYGRADGMLSAECNGGGWPSGVKDANGSLWFPTQIGIAIVDPVRMLVITS